MINGIEILSSTEVIAESAYNWTAFLLSLIIISAIGITLGIIIGKQEKSCFIGTAVSFIIIIFGSLAGAATGMTFSTPTAYKTQYKVVINETVSMTEFCERYEIIEQEGKIFTIEEKSIVN